MYDVHYWMDMMYMSRVINVAKFKLVTVQHISSSFQHLTHLNVSFPQLSLMIDNLPSVEGSLQCVFSAMGKDLTTDARRTAQGVTCTTPRNDMLPDIPQNEREYFQLFVHALMIIVKLISFVFSNTPPFLVLHSQLIVPLLILFSSILCWFVSVPVKLLIQPTFRSTMSTWIYMHDLSHLIFYMFLTMLAYFRCF